ncbi:cytochrome c oxidase subunit 3 family protein [Ancylomarina longa]|uniref:Cytochrome c oxidase subunit 3 family protein n=1 Tax=Ancylomarina longa TaxID=2487017 RepID=A0A434AY66_9BACT|nr:cytochrome c oxidase subunit 3 family protein [Ancylomarina longa]RUT79379.1 cytochrome c oxidase subunit 3 family protein [Ancylomarina longa]
MNDHVHIDEHRDDEGAKTGMWIFIFTELLLFGGLFIVYSVYRYLNPLAFHLAAHELSTFTGTINTVILLVSSMTIAMSISAIQYKNKKLTLILMGVTLFLAFLFLVNKYFEWSGKISHGIYPGSTILQEASRGEILFFGLYYTMTGLHALHIIIGMAFIGYVMRLVAKDKIQHDNFIILENSGLYWHLVDLIWIFLFPLFYLIT